MIHRKSKWLLLCLSLLLLSSCRILNPPSTQSEAELISDTVFIWISSDQDTYISCGRTAGCEEGDLNFGRHSPLAVARRILSKKLSFVHFTLPNLPSGSEISEAYLELNHNAQNEDGETDDINIPFTYPSSAWQAMTLSWNNAGSNRSPTSHVSHICLRSMDWSGSPNIAGDVQGKSEFDVLLYWKPSAQPPIEKGLASNNDFSRKQNDLGIAPRLLLRIQLPPGASLMSETSMTFQPNEDLGRLDQPVTMSIAEGGVDWPVAWDVAVKDRVCL